MGLAGTSTSIQGQKSTIRTTWLALQCSTGIAKGKDWEEDSRVRLHPFDIRPKDLSLI